MPDEIGLAERVVAFALEAGAREAEATMAVMRRFSTEARDRTIEKLEQSTARSITLRVFTQGGKATLGSSDLSEDGLRAFARETVDASRFVAPDPHAGLPEPAELGVVPELHAYAADVDERPVEAKLDDALQLEALVRAFDPRIVNSRGSHVADTAGTYAIANSKGFRGSFRQTTASLGTNPIALDGEDKRIASYGSAARGYAGLDGVADVARMAAGRAVGWCGARKPATTRCPIVFERDVAALVLGDIFAALNAANVVAGNSFLAERVGERIGSDFATLVDDGRLPDGLGSAPFDMEGVPTRRTVVFERGVLRTFLYDTYYGRRLGVASTGNAAGGGIAPNNFYLEPGRGTLEDLIASTERGVLVLDTIGFATEYVTGTYSRGARGFAIENGELAYPIEEFTIAGNLAEMLGAIDAVAADLKFEGSIVSPSFRVAEMTVSGN